MSMENDFNLNSKEISDEIGDVNDKLTDITDSIIEVEDEYDNSNAEENGINYDVSDEAANVDISGEFFTEEGIKDNLEMYESKTEPKSADLNRTQSMFVLEYPEEQKEQEELEEQPVSTSRPTQLLLDYDMTEIEKILAEIDALEIKAEQDRTQRVTRRMTPY